jgi:tetratricopeptide (TPR) repeat protein
VALVDRSYSVGEHANWKVCQALFPHAQAAADSRPGNAEVKALEAWASVLYKAAWYADEMGQYEAAREMNQSALEARKKVLGREHPDTLTSVYCLANLLAKQHMFKESLNLYNRAYDGYSIVLGEHHPTTRACRQHRSKVLESQEQSPVVFSAAALDRSVSAPTCKVSRLSRRLAHLGIRRSKHKKSQ